jgi:hypothetical protein
VSAHTDQVVDRLLTSLPALELLRVCELDEAARLSGLSRDSLVREHSDKVIRLSPRRLGMRVAHALMLQNPTAAA